MTRALNGHTSDRVVSPEGVVSVRGCRRGKVLRLRTGRWIYAQPGGRFTAESWPNREMAVDALLAATEESER